MLNKAQANMQIQKIDFNKSSLQNHLIDGSIDESSELTQTMIKNTIIQQVQHEQQKEQPQIQKNQEQTKEQEQIQTKIPSKKQLFNFATEKDFGFDISNEQSEDKSISATYTDSQSQSQMNKSENVIKQNLEQEKQQNLINTQPSRVVFKGLILPKNNKSTVRSSQTIYQQNIVQPSEQTMIAQELPQPAKALPVMQMQTSELEVQSQQQQQNNDDLTFQDLQPQITDDYQTLQDDTTISSEQPVKQVQIKKQPQIIKQKQDKKQKQQKKHHKKHHKYEQESSDSDYNPSESTDDYSDESYDYYNPQPKQQKQQKPTILRGTKFNQEIERDQDGVQNIRFIRNVDEPKALDLKVQKVEKVQKQQPQRQSIKSQQQQQQYQQQQQNTYQSYPREMEINKQKRVESIPDPVNDIVDYNYNDDDYDYNNQYEQEQQEQISQHSQHSYRSQNSQHNQNNQLTQSRRELVEQAVRIIQEQQNKQKSKKGKQQTKQHKHKKQSQNTENDEQSQYSDDDIVSPNLIEEYNNLTDTLIQPAKFEPEMYATLQIEQEQQKEEQDEVVNELLKCAIGNRDILLTRVHATLSSQKTELIEIGINPQKVTSKRLALEPLLGEKWIWADGKKVGVKLAFEIDKQQRQARFQQAWNIRHQNHIQKISEDETTKSIIYNKDGKQEEILPVLRFEKYNFQTLDKGVMTASLSQSGDFIQQIIEIEPQTKLSKQICQGDTTIFVASGNCQIRIYGNENTQQVFYLRTYDTCIIPQDCEFEAENDKNVICVILLNKSQN